MFLRPLAFVLEMVLGRAAHRNKRMVSSHMGCCICVQPSQHAGTAWPSRMHLEGDSFFCLSRSSSTSSMATYTARQWRGQRLCYLHAETGHSPVHLHGCPHHVHLPAEPLQGEDGIRGATEGTSSCLAPAADHQRLRRLPPLTHEAMEGRLW